MIGAAFRAMALGFWRDRGAIAMSVALPVLVFLVFAEIFSGASGESLRVTVGWVDEQQNDASGRLIAALGREPGVALAAEPSAAAAIDRVRRGQADAALIVRREGRSLADPTGDGTAPIVIRFDPVRRIAAQVLAGHVQRAYFAGTPDLALGELAALLDQGFVAFSPEQRDSLARRLGELREEVQADASEGRPLEGGPLEALLSLEAVGEVARSRDQVGYYAGAIAMLFLLFSAVHGALTVLEERESGLLERVLAGPGGIAALLTGKFLFLVAQGFAQVAVIFAVAWGWYRVPVGSHLLGTTLVTVAGAVAAAGLALALTSAARTKRQAQAVANVAILVTSALGGSMIPRFLMPEPLQQLGWLTPTTWAVEAYATVLWRGEPLSAVLVPVGLLLAAGLGGVLVARRLARRLERM